MKIIFLATCAFKGLTLIPNTLAAPIPVTFTLDPARSSVTMSGTVQGNTISQQGAGSLTTRYDGTLKTDLRGNSIQFTTGSFVDAEVNGNWEPKIGGAAGNDPADYAGQALNLFATVKAALRNLLLNVTSQALPVSGTNFNASAIEFAFPSSGSSSLDYRVTGLITDSGTRTLSGLASNAVGSTGTLVTAGNRQELTIPIDATFQFNLFAPNDVTLHFTGSLVATRPFGDTERLQTLVSLSGNTVTLEWQSAANESNNIESSVDLKIWAPREQGVLSSGPVTTWTATKTGPVELFRRKRTGTP
ncbi:MAG: hypothetical protein ACR2OZ_12830 [Verrucomicrobiales bacterium]